MSGLGVVMYVYDSMLMEVELRELCSFMCQVLFTYNNCTMVGWRGDFVPDLIEITFRFIQFYQNVCGIQFRFINENTTTLSDNSTYITNMNVSVVNVKVII